MQRAPATTLFTLLAAILVASPAEATFSIVAVDPANGEVGSAGASCIAGSIILSDVLPGLGGIHTQAYWNSQNQQYAHLLMEQGHSPEEIIDSLVVHDAQNNPTIRQYGIVDLVGGGRSAAYTGVNCTDYKGHILGPTYAIQGNILLGPEILTDMEAAFLATLGTLADKLMAALQAAKVPGADTRCLSYGKSSISAFLRVGRPGDPPGDLYLHLNINNTAPSQDPIDLLQELYDQWLVGQEVAEDPDVTANPGRGRDRVVLHGAQPNPFQQSTSIAFEIPRAGSVTLRIFDLAGRAVATLVDGPRGAGLHRVSWSGVQALGCGSAYLCRLEAGGTVRTLKLLQLAE